MQYEDGTYFSGMLSFVVCGMWFAGSFVGGVMGKSKATKPTRDQKILMAKKRLLAENYLVIKDTKEELVLVSKLFGRTRVIKKDPVAATTKVSR